MPRKNKRKSPSRQATITVARGIKLFGYDGMTLFLDLLRQGQPTREIMRRVHPYLKREFKARSSRRPPSHRDVMALLRREGVI